MSVHEVRHQTPLNYSICTTEIVPIILHDDDLVVHIADILLLRIRGQDLIATTKDTVVMTGIVSDRPMSDRFMIAEIKFTATIAGTMGEIRGRKNLAMMTTIVMRR